MLVAKFDIILLKWCVVLWEESLSTHFLVCPEYQLALVLLKYFLKLVLKLDLGFFSCIFSFSPAFFPGCYQLGCEKQELAFMQSDCC